MLYCYFKLFLEILRTTIFATTYYNALVNYYVKINTLNCLSILYSSKLTEVPEFFDSRQKRFECLIEVIVLSHYITNLQTYAIVKN
jgi:hypothetical protein